jgi:uncharacterized protein with PQ loop repeat
MLTKTIIENIFLIIGESFWFISGFTQLKHLIKTRDTHGLSAVSTTLNSAAGIAWIVYFIHIQLWFPVLTNIAVCSIGITTLGYILSNRRLFSKGLLAIAIIAPITSYALVTYPAAAGWLAMVYNWIANTPQLYRVVSRRKVTGLSERALFATWVAMTCVLIYGSMIQSMPLVVGSLIGMTYEAIIMRYYYRYRHRR